LTVHEVEDAGEVRNGVPVLERAIEILGILERYPEGVSIRDLTEQLNQPRSTVYRILNTLHRHAFVRRTSAGVYVLGSRLLALASQVRVDVAAFDLVAISTRHMRRLANETGEACKISVPDGAGKVHIIAAVPGTQSYALHPAVGQTFPLHAGAASKMIMAHLPQEELEAVLKNPLPQFTSRTLVDPKKLQAELRRIKQQGWAEDRGEHGSSVHALAAPIVDKGGTVIAALSIPFLAEKGSDSRALLKEAVIAAAAAISNDIP